MRKGNLTRPWSSPSSDQSRLCYSGVHMAERSAHYVRFFRSEPAGIRIYHGRRYLFLNGHRRQNTRYPFCHHGLAASGSSRHQKAVSSGHRGHDRLFCLGIAPHVGKIRRRFFLFLPRHRRSVGLLFFPIYMAGGRFKIRHRYQFDFCFSCHYIYFGAVSGRQHYLF